jgi:hypothetical protein
VARLVRLTDTCFQGVDESMRNQEASIHNLMTQIGKLAKLIGERQAKSLLGNTEDNLRERGKR